jgi:hypothetical protein
LLTRAILFSITCSKGTINLLGVMVICISSQCTLKISGKSICWLNVSRKKCKQCHNLKSNIKIFAFVQKLNSKRKILWPKKLKI